MIWDNSHGRSGDRLVRTHSGHTGMGVSIVAGILLLISMLSIGAGLEHAQAQKDTPAPIIRSVTPSHGSQGQSLELAVRGDNFSDLATVAFSPSAGVSVSSVEPRNMQLLIVFIAISPGASIGPRSVIVTNPDGQSATLGEGFFVSASAPPPPTHTAIPPTEVIPTTSVPATEAIPTTSEPATEVVPTTPLPATEMIQTTGTPPIIEKAPTQTPGFGQEERTALPPSSTRIVSPEASEIPPGASGSGMAVAGGLSPWVAGGLVVIALGGGIGLLFRRGRKKKVLALVAEDCSKIRAKNKELLKTLKQLQKQIQQAKKQSDKDRQRVQQALHARQGFDYGSVEEIDEALRQVRSDWGRLRDSYDQAIKDSRGNWSKVARLTTGKANAYLNYRRHQARLERFRKQFAESGRRRKRKSEEAIRNAQAANLQSWKDLIQKYRDQKGILDQLYQLFKEYQRCKDCCELEKLVAAMQKDIKDWQSRLDQIQKKIDKARKRENDEKRAAEDATRMAGKSRKDSSAQKAYDQALQRLKMFIGKHKLSQLGLVTMDPAKAEEWGSWVGEDAGDASGARIYAKDAETWSQLNRSLKKNKQYQDLARELKSAQERLDGSGKTAQELKREAERHQQRAQDAATESEALEDQKLQAKGLLQELKRLMGDFQFLLKSCLTDLKNCQERIKDLNDQLKKTWEEFLKCRKDFDRQVKRLATLRIALAKLLRKYPTIPALRASFKKVVEALKSARVCNKDLRAVQGPTYGVPSKVKCVKLGDCQAKVKKLLEEIRRIEKESAKCKGCHTKVSPVLLQANMAVREVLEQDFLQMEPTPGDCCPSRAWGGIGYWGGFGLLIGRHTSWITLYCLDDMSKYVSIDASSWKIGLFAGAEVGACLGYVFDAGHLHEVVDVWQHDIMGGFDYDIFSARRWAQFKGVLRQTQKRFSQALKLAMKRPAQFLRAPGKMLTKLWKEVLGIGGQRVGRSGPLRSFLKLLGLGKKAGTSTLKQELSGTATVRGFVLPLTYGVQAGLWWNTNVKAHVGSFNCCGCVGDMYKHLDEKGHFHREHIHK